MRTLIRSAAVAAAAIPITIIVSAMPAAAAQRAAAVDPPMEGYVWGWDSSNPDYFSTTGYEYNSAGGRIQILRSGVGRYQVRFHDMAGQGGVAHVSAYGSSKVCSVASWGPSQGDEVVNLRCFATGTGAAADTRFIVHVTNRTDGPARGYLSSSDPTPPAGGYEPPAQYSYDSTGKPITVTTTGVGRYHVHLGAFAQHASHDWWAKGALRVTPYGTSAVYCQILDPQVQPDPTVLYVTCYGPDGYGVNTRFVLTYTQGVEPVSATIDNYGLSPLVWSWSSPSGVKPTVVENEASYLYQLTFPKAAATGGHAFASIMGTPPMYCTIQSWYPVGDDLRIVVRCYGPGGLASPGAVLNAGFFT
jgi:hypothetical protein